MTLAASWNVLAEGFGGFFRLGEGSLLHHVFCRPNRRLKH
jgi:hypothetical protein